MIILKGAVTSLSLTPNRFANQTQQCYYLKSVDPGIINLQLIPCHHLDQYFNVPSVAAPQLISIMSTAVFQFCKTWHTPLMQMSDCASNKMKIWHQKFHLCIYTCRFGLFLDCSWLTGSSFACVWRCAVFPGGLHGLLCMGKLELEGMRAEAQYSIKV